ncbi:MAG TPA: CHAD domain-containing protein [Pseudobdellovibrionaceae bacterium]|jgi:CHAD domain-containing protein
MEVVENQFQEQVKIFNKLMHSQSQRLSLEGVHDLRVSTRRLRSLIDLLEKSTAHKVPKAAKKSLKELGDLLGDRRQWDVALQGARRYHLNTQGLLKDQRAAGSKLHKILQRPEIQKIPHELRIFGEGLGVDRVPVRDKLLQKVSTELKQWIRQKKFSKKEIHLLRISMKKIRYTFEFLDLPVNDLKDLQESLGQCHDLTVLSDYFGRPKKVKKDEQKKYKKIQKRIRPALRSSLDVLGSVR